MAALSAGLSAHGLRLLAAPRRESPPHTHTSTDGLRRCVLKPLPPAFQVEVPRTEELLSRLEEMSCTCRHPPSYTAAAKCFAGLVNKSPEGLWELKS